MFFPFPHANITGAVGGQGAGGFLFAAPTIIWDAETADATPDFEIDFAIGVQIGDVVRVQRSASSLFTSPTEATATLDGTAVSGLTLNFAGGSVSDGTYYYRARVERSAVAITDWSNTATVTISTFDAAASAIFAAFTTPPDSARKTAINNLVVALKSSGAWSKLDAFYVFAAADSQAALINWKTPGTFNATLLNAPTFTADRGFTGNGTSSNVNSNFNPSTAGGNYSSGNGCMFFRTLTTSEGQSRVEVGSATSFADQIVMDSGGAQTTVRGLLQDATFADILDASYVNADRSGFYSVNRSASNALQVYRNGTAIGSSSTSISPVVTNANMTFMYTSSFWAAVNIASGGAGASLTAPQWSSFYTAELAYMTAVGAV